MIRKLVLSLLAISSLAGSAAEPLPALLLYDENKFERIWVTGMNSTTLAYKVGPNLPAISKIARSKFKNVFFLEPELYTDAMRDFRTLDYQSALGKFQQVEAQYAPVNDQPGNYATLAAFYQLECHRLLGDLDKLEEGMDKFQPRYLEREDLKAQLETNQAWLAVHKEEWPRLASAGEKMAHSAKINDQRAQIGYCWGLACEKTGQNVKALTAYAYAITADAATSQVTVKDAVHRSLGIYKGDEEVQQAIRFYGTPDEKPRSSGHLRLLEAGALAAAYPLMFGENAKLPDEYKDFLKYATVQ